jgi:hypothetical protein
LVLRVAEQATRPPMAGMAGGIRAQAASRAPSTPQGGARAAAGAGAGRTASSRGEAASAARVWSPGSSSLGCFARSRLIRCSACHSPRFRSCRAIACSHPPLPSIPHSANQVEEERRALEAERARVKRLELQSKKSAAALAEAQAQLRRLEGREPRPQASAEAAAPGGEATPTVAAN